MNQGLAEHQARQVVQKMNALRNDVQGFAAHAKLLTESAGSFDARVLMNEADILLRKLMAARGEFQNAQANVNSLKRSLPHAVPQGGGMPPAAQWGNEFRAGSKHFLEAVQNAEGVLQKLYKTSEQGMNSPTRTASSPDGAFDILLNFIDGLSRWIERQKHGVQK